MTIAVDAGEEEKYLDITVTAHRCTRYVIAIISLFYLTEELFKTVHDAFLIAWSLSSGKGDRGK